jgi:hypothetical protein
MSKENHDYNPSPNEIKQACLKIREGWSENELMKRSSAKKPELFTVPVCDVGSSLSEFESEKNIYRF